MNVCKKILIFLISVFSLFFSLRGSDSEIPQVFNKEGLIEDVRQLVYTIESAHPDPYINGGGKVAYHRRFQQVILAIPEEGMDLVGFYRLLLPFVAAIRDAHTGISLPESSNPANNISKPGLPFGFEIVGDNLYVARVYDSLHKEFLDAILVSVNGVPMEELVNRQKRLRGYENEFSNLSHLRTGLGSLVGLQSFLEGWKSNNKIDIGFKLRNGRQKIIELILPDELPTNSIQKESKLELPSNSKSDIAYKFLDPAKKTAILQIDNMDSCREVHEIGAKRKNERALRWLNYLYRKYNQSDPPEDIGKLVAGSPSATVIFRSLVEEMKKAGTTTLLIDVRKNPGGSSLLSEILMYFIYGWNVYDSLGDSIVVRKLSRLLFENYEQSTLESVSEYSRVALIDSDYNFFSDLQESSALNQPKKKDPTERYNSYLERSPTFAEEVKTGEYEAYYCPKNVFVITRPQTMSSAFVLVSDFHKAGVAIVGVPSGQAGNSFGDLLFFRLKNSGIRVYISHKLFMYFPHDLEKGKCLRPDFELTLDKLEYYDFDPNAEILLALENVPVEER